MTVERAFPDCPDCGGQGWGFGQTSYPEEPVQEMCLRCGGTGVIDPLDKPDNSESMGDKDGDMGDREGGVRQDLEP